MSAVPVQNFYPIRRGNHMNHHGYKGELTLTVMMIVIVVLSWQLLGSKGMYKASPFVLNYTRSITYLHNLECKHNANIKQRYWTEYNN